LRHGRSVFVAASIAALFFLKPAAAYRSIPGLSHRACLLLMIPPQTIAMAKGRDRAALGGSEQNKATITTSEQRVRNYNGLRLHHYIERMIWTNSGDRLLMCFWAPIPFCHTMLTFGSKTRLSLRLNRDPTERARSI